MSGQRADTFLGVWMSGGDGCLLPWTELATGSHSFCFLCYLTVVPEEYNLIGADPKILYQQAITSERKLQGPSLRQFPKENCC